MRNPPRVRNISLIVTLLSAIVVFAAVRSIENNSGTLLQSFFILGAGTAGFFGLIYIVLGHIESRRMQRLLEGRDVLAKWTVDASRWEAFLKLNNALNAERPERKCVVKARSGPRGVEVVCGASSLLIGDDFHSLPASGRFKQLDDALHIDGPPPCIELQLTSHGESSSKAWALRVPIGAGADEAATRVVRHYKNR
jgi:hypothetical protein